MSKRILAVLVGGLMLLAIPMSVAQQDDDSARGGRRGRGQGRRGGFGRAAAQPDDTAGFVAIFDGQSLDNWDGDPRFWRVENGTIVGHTTPDNPLESNTFLIWRGGKTAEAVAQSLMYMQETVPKDFVRGVLATYPLSDEVKAQLKMSFGLE